MADSFQAKRKAGLVQGHGSGYGGTGFKFDRNEESQVKAARKAKAKVRGQGAWARVVWQCVGIQLALCGSTS